MLSGKTIVVGVSGGIAAYKSCELVSRLRKLHAEVHVIMTEHATQFVCPLTFETLSNHPVITDMFHRETPWEVEHISLAKKADLFLIAPATANIIGKVANGIADDMLSTTIMATKAPVLFAPAMNSGMYTNSVFQHNLERLTQEGYGVISAQTGFLACGDEGVGRMPEPEDLVQEVLKTLCPNRDYQGKKILITAGATYEKLDAVRVITNFSSGKMGCEIAKRALERGAEVTLILGQHSVLPPQGVKIRSVSTTDEMYRAVMEEFPQADVIVKAAAPCDYKPKHYSETKIKSQELTLEFEKNPDIAAEVGKRKENRVLVAFAAETDHLEENAAKKLRAKNADLVVANDVTQSGAGFGTETNIVTVFRKDGSNKKYDKMSKSAVADVILDEIKPLL